MGDSEVVVTRWRRYGHDRLYVSRGTGEKVGWWDLEADAGHPAHPGDAATLGRAVNDWKRRERFAAAPVGLRGHDLTTVEPLTLQLDEGGVTVEPRQVTEHMMRPWLDLATNLPGAEAREQALSARDEAPVRSLLSRMLGMHTDERSWRIGADGEEKVAARLAKLTKKDPRWRVLHAIPVGTRGADIDHLVIGPGGIFTINAKHHPDATIWVAGDTFLVNGHKQPYIRNSRHEAARAGKLLTSACGFPVHVEGIVVTVNAKDVRMKRAPSDVHIVQRMHIAHWLARHGEVHPDPALEEIYDAARRSTTWRS